MRKGLKHEGLIGSVIREWATSATRSGNFTGLQARLRWSVYPVALRPNYQLRLSTRI